MPVATQLPATSLQTSPLCLLPSEIVVVAESQWLFTEHELLRTPSILDGLTPDKERENRSKGVNFILQVGIMLKLPQITLATASVFLHRFYMRNSMVDSQGKQGFHYYSMAATSLFLATKVEENCRKMKELVVACVRVAQKDAHKAVDEQDKEYWRWRDNILHHEDLLLEAICFDLSLEPPYKFLFELLTYFQEENNKKLRNSAWAFVNDSCLTMLCLLFSSRTIATSALYLAARHSHVAFPDDAGRPWWEMMGVPIRDIRKACNYMIDTYEGAPVKPGRENGLYERSSEIEDELRDPTRMVSPTVMSRSGPDDGSVRDDSSQVRKRNWESNAGTEGKPYNDNEIHGVNDGIEHGMQGDPDSSPRKRRRVSEEKTQLSVNQAYHENSTSTAEQESKTSVSNGGPVSKTSVPTSDADGLKDGIAGPSGGGLVSPRLGDASEEGEV